MAGGSITVLKMSRIRFSRTFVVVLRPSVVVPISKMTCGASGRV